MTNEDDSNVQDGYEEEDYKNDSLKCLCEFLEVRVCINVFLTMKLLANKNTIVNIENYNR